MRKRKIKVFAILIIAGIIAATLFSIAAIREGYRFKYPFSMCNPKMYAAKATLDGSNVRITGFLVNSSADLIGCNYKIDKRILYVIIFSRFVVSRKDARIGYIDYNINVCENNIDKVILVGGLFDDEKILYPR